MSKLKYTLANLFVYNRLRKPTLIFSTGPIVPTLQVFVSFIKINSKYLKRHVIMKNFDSEKIRKKKMNYAFKFSTYLRSFLFKGYSHYEIKK